MKYFSGYPVILLIVLVLSLTAIGAQANEAVKDFGNNLSRQPLAQITGSTITPTATILPADQTTIALTPMTTATLPLEPFPAITLIFPELTGSTTPSATLATKEPSRGIPLSMISTNNPPTRKASLFYVVIVFWLMLVIFAVIIARKAYQIWIDL